MKRLWMTCILAGLMVSPLASSKEGFRPGLWAITSLMTGAMQFTSHRLDCLHSLNGSDKTVAVLGPTGPRGPVGVQVKSGPHTTRMVWHDKLRQGGALTEDHGWYRFRHTGQTYVMQGFWSRRQTVFGHVSIYRETLHGHWVNAACPAMLPPATVSSSALQELTAGAAALGAANTREQARLAKH